MAFSEGLSKTGAKTGIAALTLSVVALVLAVATVWQSIENRDLQAQGAAAQQQVGKAQAMANLDNTLVQLLAKAAVEGNDAQLRSLLEANSVQLRTGSNTGPNTGPNAAAPAPKALPDVQ